MLDYRWRYWIDSVTIAKVKEVNHSKVHLFIIHIIEIRCTSQVKTLIIVDHTRISLFRKLLNGWSNQTGCFSSLWSTQDTNTAEWVNSQFALIRIITYIIWSSLMSFSIINEEKDCTENSRWSN